MLKYVKRIRYEKRIPQKIRRKKETSSSSFRSFQTINKLQKERQGDGNVCVEERKVKNNIDRENIRNRNPL